MALLFTKAAPLIAGLLCTVYPIRCSFAVFYGKSQDFHRIMVYWSMFAFISLWDFYFSQQPIYWIFKVVVCVYLYLPQTQGALYLYSNIIEPVNFLRGALLVSLIVSIPRSLTEVDGNGCIWVLGGNTGHKILSTIEKYRPQTDSRIQMPEMRRERKCCAAAACNGKIIVCGRAIPNGLLRCANPCCSDFATPAPISCSPCQMAPIPTSPPGLRLAVDTGMEAVNREFTGFVDCTRKIMKTDGLRGLYRGFSSSVQGIIIYRASYFGLFDTITGTITHDKRNLIFLANWMIGQFVIVSSGLICYSWDTVRRRMMMQSGREDTLYKTAWHCWKKIYVEEGGLRGFYKGALSNVFRGLGSALCLAFYAEVQKVVN